VASNTVSFQTKDGRSYELDVPTPGNVGSYFLFSLPKAGSTLLMQLMSDVNKVLGIPMIDLPTRLFTLGINPPELKDDINRLWQVHGYAYMGFRSFLPTMNFDLSTTKNILLIRDPRDMLVSLYFSVKYSHRIPKMHGEEHPLERARNAVQEIEIDQFVLNRAPAVLNLFLAYIKHLPCDSTRVYRYEDVIFRKSEWIEDMLCFLGLYLSRSKIKEIAEKHDIHPDMENPKKHVRQVTPGNYKYHLCQATIEKLDDTFRPVTRYFKFDSVVSLAIGADENGYINRNWYNPVGFNDERIRLLEKKIDSLLRSWSWRVTSPLRRIASLFRNIRRGKSF